MEIKYTPSFIRSFKKLPKQLQEEVKEKISLFKVEPHHPYLKTHKLKVKLRDYYSLSVNYKYRIVFEYDSPKLSALLGIGTHQIYE